MARTAKSDAPEADAKTEEVKETSTEEAQASEDQHPGREITSEERANPFVAQHAAELEDEEPRIVKEGEAIDVDTDENGIATETVLREGKHPGTTRPTYYQVARKGSLYKK